MKKILAGIFLVLAGCSSGTQVTSSWKSPDAPSSSAAYNKVMVVALLAEKDRSLQQAMETQMVNELSAKGISAASAFQIYGPKVFPKNEDQTLRQLKRAGADAVMTISLLDKTKEKNYVPGNATYQPVGIYYNRFWGYYNYAYSRMYTPGYYTENTSYFWESNLYDVRSGKLIYSVQTESFDPSSTESLSKDYSKKILENMMKQGVLVKN